MADFVYSGGVRFDDAAVADVTMDKDGHPLTCKNPITGEEISGGGGESDFSTCKLTSEGLTTESFQYRMGSMELETEVMYMCPNMRETDFYDTTEYTLLLYKGCGVFISADCVLEGNCTPIREGEPFGRMYLVTGDCVAKPAPPSYIFNGSVNTTADGSAALTDVTLNTNAKINVEFDSVAYNNISAFNAGGSIWWGATLYEGTMDYSRYPFGIAYGTTITIRCKDAGTHAVVITLANS